MYEFIISYIEDNELGIYNKEILVQADSFIDCVEKYKEQYPTMCGVQQLYGVISPEWRNFYTSEVQDLLQKSKREGNGLDFILRAGAVFNVCV